LIWLSFEVAARGVIPFIMSQFCGSFCALTSRSLLTVSLYSAAGADATRAASETPARPMQASWQLAARSEVKRLAKFDMLRTP